MWINLHIYFVVRFVSIFHRVFAGAELQVRARRNIVESFFCRFALRFCRQLRQGLTKRMSGLNCYQVCPKLRDGMLTMNINNSFVIEICK